MVMVQNLMVCIERKAALTDTNLGRLAITARPINE